MWKTMFKASETLYIFNTFHIVLSKICSQNMSIPHFAHCFPQSLNMFFPCKVNYTYEIQNPLYIKCIMGFVFFTEFIIRFSYMNE